MFHRHQPASFEPRHAPYGTPYSTGGQWYVSDAQYHEAIRRGMQMRSEVAAGLVKALGRRIARLFRA